MRPVARYGAALGLVLALAACETGGADLILTGGTVWTGDDDRPVAEAVAVRGNRILAVGSATEMGRHRGRETRVIDLDGRFVAPAELKWVWLSMKPGATKRPPASMTRVNEVW
jgi:hypothetical protein